MLLGRQGSKGIHPEVDEVLVKSEKVRKWYLRKKEESRPSRRGTPQVVYKATKAAGHEERIE